MSHKASSWLAEIPASALTGSQFRVLFHLCDSHNSKRDPETACFPSQERLREATGLSNGGLNNALNALEEAGFIQRLRRTAPGARVQRTYYILGCDDPTPQEQTPESGVRTNSTFCGTNSTFRANKLHLSGEYPVSNKEKEHARQGGTAESGGNDQSREGSSSHPKRAHQAARSRIAENSNAQIGKGNRDRQTVIRLLADWVNSGRHVPPSAVSNQQRDAMLAAGLVTPERLRELQIY